MSERSDTPARAPDTVRQPHLSTLSTRRTTLDDEQEDELLGLRQDDLDAEERKRLRTTLSTDRGARDRARAMTLARELGSLPAPESDLHPGHVLEALARRRRTRRLTRIGLVVGALGLVAMGAVPATWMSLPAEPGRTVQHVTIEANARLDGRALPVWRRAEIPADAELSLTVTTTGPGTLFVRERFGYGETHGLDPLEDGHLVEAGHHALIGPLEPRHVPMDVVYEAWLCPEGTARPTIQKCRADKVDVAWR